MPKEQDKSSKTCYLKIFRKLKVNEFENNITMEKLLIRSNGVSLLTNQM